MTDLLVAFIDWLWRRLAPLFGVPEDRMSLWSALADL